MSQDKDLENYLQGNSGLSQVYADLPEVKLPDHLDNAILAEAHRAVKSRPGGKPGRSWTIPVSIAASLFVVAIVVMQLPYLLPGTTPTPESVPAMRVPASPTSSVAPATATPLADSITVQKKAIAPEPESLPPAAATAPDAALMPIEEPAPQLKAGAGRNAQANRATIEAKPAAKAPVTVHAGRASPPAGDRLMIREGAATPPPPAAARAEQSIAEEQDIAADKYAAPAPSHQAKEDARAEQKATLPAAVSPGRGNEKYQMSEQVEPAVAATPPPPSEKGAPSREISADAQPAMSAEKQKVEETPLAWLKRIAKLKKQGKLTQARKELAAFRKRYPKYHLPKELQDLANSTGK